jgi:transposase
LLKKKGELHMGLVVKDDGWRIPDKLWEEMGSLLPPGKPHPLGCHNPRVPDRDAMNAILFVLRTGCQWGALDATGICNHSSAHRRFQQWVEAGVFEQFWIYGLLAYDELQGINWSWLSMDGAMTKAPLGGEKNRAKPRGSSQKRRQTQPAHRGRRRSGSGGGRRSQPQLSSSSRQKL